MNIYEENLNSTLIKTPDFTEVREAAFAGEPIDLFGPAPDVDAVVSGVLGAIDEQLAENSRLMASLQSREKLLRAAREVTLEKAAAAETLVESLKWAISCTSGVAGEPEPQAEMICEGLYEQLQTTLSAIDGVLAKIEP